MGGKPAGRRFSRTGPGMAHCGGPPNQCRSTGMPSLSEAPSGGARAFCLLLAGPAFRLSKVSRCKSGTIGGRYRKNGYVLGLIQHPGRPTGATSHHRYLCSRCAGQVSLAMPGTATLAGDTCYIHRRARCPARNKCIPAGAVFPCENSWLSSSLGCCQEGCAIRGTPIAIACLASRRHNGH